MRMVPTVEAMTMTGQAEGEPKSEYQNRGYHYIRYAMLLIYIPFLGQSVDWSARGIFHETALGWFGVFVTVLAVVVDLRNQSLWHRHENRPVGRPIVSWFVYVFYGFCGMWFIGLALSLLPDSLHPRTVPRQDVAPRQAEPRKLDRQEEDLAKVVAGLEGRKNHLAADLARLQEQSATARRALEEDARTAEEKRVLSRQAEEEIGARRTTLKQLDERRLKLENTIAELETHGRELEGQLAKVREEFSKTGRELASDSDRREQQYLRAKQALDEKLQAIAEQGVAAAQIEREIATRRAKLEEDRDVVGQQLEEVYRRRFLVQLPPYITGGAIIALMAITVALAVWTVRRVFR